MEFADVSRQVGYPDADETSALVLALVSAGAEASALRIGCRSYGNSRVLLARVAVGELP